MGKANLYTVKDYLTGEVLAKGTAGELEASGIVPRGYHTSEWAKHENNRMRDRKYNITYATSEAMADAELALLRQAVYGKELTLPVAVDVEENKLKPMSTLDLTNLTAYALEQVEKMGFYAQLYTYTGYKYELDMARLSSRWDVWLADYTGKTPNVTFNYNAHQHTSKGSVPGITGNVDLNVTTLNYPRIIRKKGLTRLREGA